MLPVCCWNPLKDTVSLLVSDWIWRSSALSCCGWAMRTACLVSTEAVWWWQTLTPPCLSYSNAAKATHLPPHSVSLSAVLSGRGSGNMCADDCFCACAYVCARNKDRLYAWIDLFVYASMRGSLKRSFILKYTVQGERSDELFRDIPHRRKKVFLEVRPLQGCVCICMCAVKAKGSE